MQPIQPSSARVRGVRFFLSFAAVVLFATMTLTTTADAAEREFQIGKIVRKDADLGFFYVDVGCPACIPKSAAHVKDAGGKVRKIKLLGYSYSNQMVYAAQPRDQTLDDLKIGQKVFQTCEKKVKTPGKNPCLKVKKK